MPIVLVLEGRVRNGQRDALEAFLREARPFYESIGDVTMQCLWHADDPNRFRETFHYRTEAAYLQDNDRVENDTEMQQYLARWRELLDGDISVSVWHEMSTS